MLPPKMTKKIENIKKKKSRYEERERCKAALFGQQGRGNTAYTSFTLKDVEGQ